MIRENAIKKKLQAGKPVLGTFVKLYDPSAVELLGLLGFDFFVIDNEHVAMSRERMVQLIRAGDGAGITPVVRVRENRAVEMLQALDEGALGIMVPQVDTKEQAEAAVRSMKYAPLGQRGFAPSHRAAGYGTMDPVLYASMANEHTLVVCYCETVESIRNLDEIIRVPEVDVIFIGPFDLSQSLGVIGQADHPAVREAIDSIIAKVRSVGKAVGIIAGNAQEAKRYVDMGVHYITISSDLGMLAAGAKTIRAEWKGLLDTHV